MQQFMTFSCVALNWTDRGCLIPSICHSLYGWRWHQQKLAKVRLLPELEVVPFLGPLDVAFLLVFLKRLKGPTCQENCSKKWFLHVQTTWDHFELLCLGLRFLSFWVDFLSSKELLVVRWKVPWCKDEESPKKTARASLVVSELRSFHCSNACAGVVCALLWHWSLSIWSDACDWNGHETISGLEFLFNLYVN